MKYNFNKPNISVYLLQQIYVLYFNFLKIKYMIAFNKSDIIYYKTLFSCL